MDQKIKIKTGSIEETLLLPLWGRAYETQKKHPRLIGADLIIIPHASPRGSAQEKLDSWKRHLLARAYDNGLYLKITNALIKAGEATGEFNDREAKKMTMKVLTLARDLHLGPVPEVEEIQDIVEQVLLDSPYYKTAKAYIIYREQHNQIRRIAIDENVGLMDSYISRMDWKVKENSNMSYSLQGLNNYISSDITAEYWLNKIYPPPDTGRPLRR